MSLTSSTRLRNARTAVFVVFFAWISFFPMFKPWSFRIALFGSALLLLLLDRTTRAGLFSWRDAPFWLFLLALTASLAAAGNKPAALHLYLYLAAGLTASYYIGKGLALDPAVWMRVVWTVALFSACVGLLGIIESITGKNLFYEHTQANPYYLRFSRLHRPLVTQFHYAPLSSYLLAAWPFALVLSRRRSPRVRRAGRAALVLTLLCLALTLNRSALLGLIAMAVFYSLVRGRYKRVGVASLLFVGVISVATFLPAPVNRIGWTGLAREDAGIFSRYRTRRLALARDMFRDNPDFGVGLGHYRLLFHQYYRRHPNRVPLDVRVADNMFATLLAETGAFGLGAFGFWMLWLLAAGVLAYRRAPPLQAHLLALAMSALVGLLLSMGGYDLLYWNGPSLFFGLLGGLAAGWSARVEVDRPLDFSYASLLR